MQSVIRGWSNSRQINWNLSELTGWRRCLYNIAEHVSSVSALPTTQLTQTNSSFGVFSFSKNKFFNKQNSCKQILTNTQETYINWRSVKNSPIDENRKVFLFIKMVFKLPLRKLDLAYKWIWLEVSRVIFLLLFTAPQKHNLK